MAQNWHCNQGDDGLAVVVLSWPETGEVITPCLEHWVGLCIAVASEAGMVWPATAEISDQGDSERPAPSTEADTTATLHTGERLVGPDGETIAEVVRPVPPPPDLAVAKVVRRSGGRRRSQAERGAMHAHLREAEGGDQGG